MNKLLHRVCLGAMAMGCAVSLASAPARAQSITDTSLYADVNSVGKKLKDSGIYLQLGYGEIVASLVSGGFETGTFPTGELYFGTILDLQTILGIPGASFHITFDERNGYAVNANAGTQGPLNSNSGPTRATRLAELFWEQAFFSDRIDIRVGRTNPTLDFFTSDVACQFVASIICAQPGSFYFSNNSINYPASSWGGFLNVVPAPNVYVRTGVYDDDTSQLNGNQNGFNWNTSGSAGVFIPIEAGYQTNFTNALLPAHYSVGFYWDDATYTPPGLSKKNGRTAYNFLAEQTVWRPDQNTNQSLTIFGGGMIYNGGAPYWSQFYAGLFDRAPFGPVRPRDSIALIGSYYANNSNQRPNKSTQWIYELNYGFSLIPGVTLQPYTQYVVHPNNFLAPIGSKQPDNAWVVGIQVSLDFAAMFGFPKFVAY